MDATTVEAIQKRARDITAVALANVADFEEAELSLSMALLLVQGMAGALQRKDLLAARARHEEGMAGFDWRKYASVPGRTTSA